MKDLHITLPDSLAQEADRLATDLGDTRNGILRKALEEYIASMRKRKIESEMKRYAQTMADQSGEFVKETGPTVTRKILRETKW